MAKRSRRPEKESLACADLAKRLCAFAFGIPLEEILAPSRGLAMAAFARQTAMYLCHVVGGLSFSAIGRAFTRDRTTAAHSCTVVEDRRDDPRIDALIASLENALRAAGLSSHLRLAA